MDQSLFAALNDAVAADATRLSGRRFADARGAGIARRVRTRRTVRAVGAGGASAVAVGALALGATHLPWGSAAQPVGSWPAGCTPTPVADVGGIWADAAEPRAHVIDVSAEHEEATWYLYDDTLEMVVLVMVPTPFGLNVTFADGTRQRVTSKTSPWVFEAPGGGWVAFDPTASEPTATWQAEAPAEPSTVVPQDQVTPPFGWQWEGCDLVAPSASSEPSASVGPSPSPAPSLAATPEDVVGDSPFECGFEFPKDSYGTEALSIDDPEWLTREEVEDEHPPTSGFPVTWGSADPDALVPRVTVKHEIPAPADGGTSSGVAGIGEPTQEALSEIREPESAAYTYVKGRTFVGVQEGTVVATGNRAGEDETARNAIFTSKFDGGTFKTERMYLIEPAVALTSCDSNPVDLERVDIVAVAGLLVQNEDGTVNPTIYAWQRMGEP